jgi:hypothetical protein
LAFENRAQKCGFQFKQIQLINSDIQSRNIVVAGVEPNQRTGRPATALWRSEALAAFSYLRDPHGHCVTSTKGVTREEVRADQFLYMTTKIERTIDRDFCGPFGGREHQRLCFWRISNCRRITTASGGDTVIPSSSLLPLCLRRWTSSELSVLHCLAHRSDQSHPRYVQSFCSDSIAACSSVSSILFENDLRLTHIKSYSFSRFALKSNLIPHSAQTLHPFCFAECKAISSILFERESELMRIQPLLSL